jgi:aminoglycoside phosphotransferase (APT) family kinase protein
MSAEAGRITGHSTPAASPLTGEQAAALARAALGGDVLRVRRLRGGADRHVYEVILSGRDDGGAQRVVVRGYGEDLAEARFEAAVLRWLEPVGVAAPRLLGEGDGALVISRLPGRPALAPRDVAAWAGGLATTLAALHRAPLEGASFLPDHRCSLTQELATGGSERLLRHPDGVRIWEELRQRHEQLAPVPPALMHGDYFPGNVLWWRGRVSGVIDWEGAGMAEPGNDVGNCRAELAMYPGGEAPEFFLRAYEREMGPVPDLPFWDLLGAAWLLPDPERYLPAARALGMKGLTADLMHERLWRFAASALRK